MRDSNVTKIVGIITALDMCLDMGWKDKWSLIIETWADMVFNWLMHNRMRPWVLQASFFNSKLRMVQVGEVCFSTAEKSRKEMAFASYSRK